MGIMAGSALAIFDRLMFDLGGRDLLLKFVVTIGTQFAIGFFKEMLDIGFMGVVAGGTFAIFDGHVFDLGGGSLFLEIVVAVEAEFTIGFQQERFLVGGVGVVTGGALVVFRWLMLYLRRFWNNAIFVQQPRFPNYKKRCH